MATRRRLKPTPVPLPRTPRRISTNSTAIGTNASNISTNASDITALDGRVMDLEDANPNPNPDPPCFDNFNRYVDCGNGTVTDTVAGLIWLQDASCNALPGLNGSELANYRDANEAAALLEDGICGLGDNSKPGDWRLPTKEEWVATIALAAGFPMYCVSPTLTDRAGNNCFASDPAPAFSGVQSVSYWSSSSAIPGVAWVVNLDDGNTSGGIKTFGVLVWPVRGGQ